LKRLGIVSFLNSRPLIAGLAGAPDVDLLYDVPAALEDWLVEGNVDAALVPIIDVLHAGNHRRVISDACIASDGETMTVRVFSHIAPDRIRTLYVDGDSHTSVALASVLWRRVYNCNLELKRVDARGENLAAYESVLLIGDKVVRAAKMGFKYELDLGSAWKMHTGLPFVFAVWACRAPDDLLDFDELAGLLSVARDRGVADADSIAQMHGPSLGWPVDMARLYLTKRLTYRLDERHIKGAELFGRYCAELDIIPSDALINWPASLQALSG